MTCHLSPLPELIDDVDSALNFVIQTAGSVPGRCVVHPPSVAAPEALHRTQVSTRSPMGAVVYHTGGISVMNGWLRILGSGSPAIPRALPEWNLERSSGFYLVADDVFGGFFALDGGALGTGKSEVFYFSPRSLQWESLACTYTQFLIWACSDFKGFYDDMIWTGCEEAISSLKPDRCLFFYPPLWTAECVLPPPEIHDIPVAEMWGLQLEMKRQLNGDGH